MATKETQRAIVALGSGVAKLVDIRPIPKLRDEYLLVKTKAVALNPSDWKHIKYLIQEPGPLVGCDYAGVVEEVGSHVKKDFKKGDRVCGVAHGSNAVQHEDGTFAEYIVVKAAVQIHIPLNLSFEEAATLGAGITTVGQGLYQTLGLALPNHPISEPLPILIYGGSTATSALGIQFAKLSGYTVVTTCSPQNFAQVKANGADAVFDYKDPECANKIRQFTNGKLLLAWDTISLPASAKICAESLTAGSGAKYASLLPVDFPREDVSCSYTLAYSALGEAFTFGSTPIAASPQDLEYASQFWDLAKGFLDSGKVKIRKPRVENGLENILKGLEDLENNNVSNEKLVYTI